MYCKDCLEFDIKAELEIKDMTIYRKENTVRAKVGTCHECGCNFLVEVYENRPNTPSERLWRDSQLNSMRF